ncbi:MAG TPA: hypothetical protein VN541_25230 [Tepidisphaeraceae bacterium]|jgi:hypothetical protein|nr:hypothetical protein [Tepidisphaeraceae bacterium]
MGLSLVENTLRIGYLSLVLSLVMMTYLTMRPSLHQNRATTPRRRRASKKDRQQQ